MGLITAILPQKKDKTRCNIYIDGQFYCGMMLEVVMQNRLKCGIDVGAGVLDTLQLESEKMSALDKALNHLSSTMKTEKQIIDFLKKKGYLDGIIDYVLDKLRSYGYVNDEEYSRQFVNSASKRKGKRLIALELQKKGIAHDDAKLAVENIEGEDEVALNILKKYMRNKLTDKETLYKAFRYLIGKGFEYEVAKIALENFGELDENS